jgi:ankyrin repeat protein
MQGKIFYLKRIAFSVILLVIPGISPAQYVPVDTSDYLSMSYEGALDYNLLVAAEKGYHSEIERLLVKGADIECSTFDGATPLIYAVVNNNYSTVISLLAYNADVNKITTASETPLLIAVKGNYPDIAEALIRNGANIDYQDNKGVTALNYASIYNNLVIADLLLYYDANIDLKANDGTSPLIAATWSGNSEIAELLVQNGANLEARDNEGYTPFLVSAQMGDTLCLNILIRNGVDIYEKNRYNYDALDLAIKSGNTETVKLLLKAGDRWNDQARDAINPYNVAAKYQRKDVIDLLEDNNFPRHYKPVIDQMAVSVSSKFNSRDFYSSFSLWLKEPLFNFGLTGGIDTKLWYTKVLVKKSDDLYYQYMDMSSVIYGGLFKEFSLSDVSRKDNYSVFLSLCGGYSFGNKFKGTELNSGSKFILIPEAGMKWSRKNLIIYSGIDYMESGFFRISPFWCRIGLSYNFFFDNIRSTGKTIRWY